MAVPPVVGPRHLALWLALAVVRSSEEEIGPVAWDGTVPQRRPATSVVFYARMEKRRAKHS